MRLSWLWQLIHSQIASSSAEVYRPHYRVCTAPMPASVTRTAGAAEEHIYKCVVRLPLPDAIVSMHSR